MSKLKNINPCIDCAYAINLKSKLGHKRTKPYPYEYRSKIIPAPLEFKNCPDRKTKLNYKKSMPIINIKLACVIIINNEIITQIYTFESAYFELGIRKGWIVKKQIPIINAKVIANDNQVATIKYRRPVHRFGGGKLAQAKTIIASYYEDFNTLFI